MFLNAPNTLIYADSGILNCIREGDISCKISYQNVLRIPEFLQRGLHDSALAYLDKAIEVIEDKDLPVWKAYLHTLRLAYAFNVYKHFDVDRVNKEDLIRWAKIVDSVSRNTPLALYGKCARNSFLLTQALYVREEYQTSMEEILEQPQIRFKQRLPITFYGFSTVMDTNLTELMPLICWIRDKTEELGRWVKPLTKHPDPVIALDATLTLIDYLQNRGMPTTAKRYFQKLDSLARNLKDPILRIFAHTGMGDFANSLLSSGDVGRYHRRRALEIADSLGIQNSLIYETLLNNCGLSAEDPWEALNYLRKSLQLHIKNHGYYTDGVANVMANMSNAFLELGEMDSSIEYNRKLIDVRRKARGKVDLYVFAEYIGLAQRYMIKGDSARGKEIARAALDSMVNYSEYLHLPASFFLYGKAVAYYMLGMIDSAIVVMEGMRNSMKEYPHFFLDLAWFYMLNDNVEMALEALDSAFTILKEDRTPVLPIARKEYLQYIAQKWEKVIPLMLKHGSTHTIPIYSELLKSKLLLEDVSYSFDPVIDSLQRHLFKLIDENAPLDSLIEIDRQLMKRINEKRTGNFVEEPPEIPENIALLGYVVGHKHLLSYLISRTDTVIVWKDITRDSLTGMVKKLVSNPSLKHTVSRRLWELLIEPFDTLLTRFDRVAISPHGTLAELPFSILFDGHEYLVQKPYTTYRVFSLWSFDIPCTVEGPALALGRNDYGENPVLHRRGIGNLKYAEEEASSVVKSMGGLALIGDEVSEDRIYRINLNEFSVIHFATHAIVDSQSMIVLGPRKDTIPFMDNVLRLGEIYSRLRVGKLVVLSGCRTGLGKFINDWEGLFNLTRGFVYTGARCVITTKWDINDMASYQLMKKMYEYLSKGYPVDLALKKAQMYLLQETGLSSPVYWGAFTLTVFGR